MDILSKINTVLTESETKLKTERAKARGLSHTSFNNYKDKAGNNYTWDEKSKNFKQGGKDDGQGDIKGKATPEIIIAHFIEKYELKDNGDGQYKDKHGNLWVFDFKGRRLKKTQKAEKLDPKAKIKKALGKK